MRRVFAPVWTVVLLGLLVAGCGGDSPLVTPPGRPCADFDPLRLPFWGDTHIHTNLSLDANLQGTRTSMEDAYAFARGEPIGIQPYEENGNPSRTAQIDRPLDFVMLSDHAEFLGTIRACIDDTYAAFDDPRCEDYRAALAFDADPVAVRTLFVELNAFTAADPDEVRYPALCGTDAEVCIEAGKDVWMEVVQAAEAAYDRTSSCEFTSFVGYEWSGGPNARNWHRNVMFKDENVPELAFSYFDEPYPEDLWGRLQSDCIDANTGCDVIAIPHNTNLSQGLFFENVMKGGEPFTAEYAATRNALEPVFELYQHKGASECLPGEPSADELCGFEILPYTNLGSANLEQITPPDPRGFLRYAYGEGMKHEESLGTNPFELGITAATDTHISAPGLVAENNFKGHGGAGAPNRFLPAPEGFPDIQYFSNGGLTAVWAEENSREAIFAAMRRKETFGTSGPRILVRFYGGYEYPIDLCDAEDLAAQGDAGGVPMGGTLGPAPTGASPRFVVSARQDPQGAPLQRIQIVKGWQRGDSYQTTVYEVVGDADNGASVDLQTCELQGTGAADLCTVWEDPDFDPTERAYYYVRVIENPSCRWSSIQCVEAAYDCDNPTREIDLDCCDPTAGLNVAFCEAVDCTDPDLLPPAEARCCVPRVEPVIQERAWTSPIWYRPPG